MFKSIYFSDHPATATKEKTVTLSFGAKERALYDKVRRLSSEEIREMIDVKDYQQLLDFSEVEQRSLNHTIKTRLKKKLVEPYSKLSVTFSSSSNAPFQRWYGYLEGYSIDFVEQIANDYAPEARRIIDPFVGTGTALFAAERLGATAFYSEVNPLLRFLIETKYGVLRLNGNKRMELADRMEELRKGVEVDLDTYQPDGDLAASYRSIFGDSIYFSENNFSNLLKTSTLIKSVLSTEGPLAAALLKVACVRSILPSSLAKKVGDVRFKTGSELQKQPPEDFQSALSKSIEVIVEDLLSTSRVFRGDHVCLGSDATNLGMLPKLDADLVVTSPPYLNGTNYFRNTKLELWFLGLLRSQSELRRYRDRAITAGINDVRLSIESPITTPHSSVLDQTLSALEIDPYDRRIPKMVKAYFQQMDQVIRALSYHLRPGGKIAIDIGDSVFGGVPVPTDKILSDLMVDAGLPVVDEKELRTRRSKNGHLLFQRLLVHSKPTANAKLDGSVTNDRPRFDKVRWKEFKTVLPHLRPPFNKRNWGHANHSICSYQGKLKPAIAKSLVDTFVPENGTVFDPFCGVGTIPFEAGLSGKRSFGLDISYAAYSISRAKCSLPVRSEVVTTIGILEEYVRANGITDVTARRHGEFGLNRTLLEYYHSKTFSEILSAREFFQKYPPSSTSEFLVFASLLHILHGNRPYALSRRSHPIVPYAPSGPFEYKNLIEKVTKKVNRVLANELPSQFVESEIFLGDCTKDWPMDIEDLDAIVTSPPFFDSTRFHSGNWIRLWFAGWKPSDFNHLPRQFIDERQKSGFEVYRSILALARERLKTGGVLVFHLGNSKKADMAEALSRISKHWFKEMDRFEENVSHCESHGVTDKGSVTGHQYLVLH